MRSSISHPKMTWKAFVRTTRPSFYALFQKQYDLVIFFSLTGGSSHEELNWPGAFWRKSYNNPCSGMTKLCCSYPVCWYQGPGISLVLFCCPCGLIAFGLKYLSHRNTHGYFVCRFLFVIL